MVPGGSLLTLPVATENESIVWWVIDLLSHLDGAEMRTWEKL